MSAFTERLALEFEQQAVRLEAEANKMREIVEILREGSNVVPIRRKV